MGWGRAPHALLASWRPVFEFRSRHLVPEREGKYWFPSKRVIWVQTIQPCWYILFQNSGFRSLKFTQTVDRFSLKSAGSWQTIKALINHKMKIEIDYGSWLNLRQRETVWLLLFYCTEKRCNCDDLGCINYDLFPIDTFRPTFSDGVLRAAERPMLYSIENIVFRWKKVNHENWNFLLKWQGSKDVSRVSLLFAVRLLRTPIHTSFVS